ncbi:MAG: outer membrane beta-barrel protein [Polyangiaceae bacterium]
MHRASAIFSSLIVPFLFVLPSTAQAQIKQPGQHPHYAFELEPHFTFQWDHGPDYYGSEGVGLGLRASIPLFHNGPIPSINNNMAITFGLDWVHFGYDRNAACVRFRGGFCNNNWDFSANALWFPVALQWNFFVHKSISVFGEVGLAFAHTRYSWAQPCPQSPNGLCEYRDSSTRFPYFVFYPGARFMLSDSIGITVRVGYPHLTAGASFLF